MILKIAKELAPKEEGAPSYVDLMRVTASDISPTACDMSLLNFTLWGIPAEVMHQNSLSLETWNHWKTIHWHRVGEDARREFNAVSRFLSNPPESTDSEKENTEQTKQQGRSSTEVEADYTLPRREGNGGQFEMDF